MAWIESHQAVGSHPKTKKLARLLGVSLPAAVGHLHYLWWWALDFAQDGDLSRYDAYDIKDATHWDGDEDKMLEALIDTGYIDVYEDGTFHLHDWTEYAGKLLERRAKDRARKREAADTAKKSETFRRKSDGTDAEIGKTRTDSFVTNQPTNQPTNLNQPTNQPEEVAEATQPPESPKSQDPTPYKEIVALFHDICNSYPKLRNVSDSRKKAIAARWKEYGHSLETFRELFEKAEASPFLKGKNSKNWTADFNWLMNSENMAKVLEGKYDSDRAKGGQTHGELRPDIERPENGAPSRSETALSGFHMA